MEFSPFTCEIELDLKWTKNCVISEISRTSVVPANPTIPAIAATRIIGATFQINNAKLYVPVVALSIKDNIKFLENKRDLKEKFLGTNIDLK